MWNLIVSVPDHFRFIYFSCGEKHVKIYPVFILKFDKFLFVFSIYSTVQIYILLTMLSINFLDVNE